ncbi:MAG: hypothetical protein HY036_06050 [Nitrospirae bacterium]|nr:hypothetical protein [Nitrospirota bacterium]MBI3352124.1 hypothetical protein [Nitrospirota bacterium]
MPEKIRKVDYFKMEAANKAGEAARILGALKKGGVNLLAFSGFPKGRRAQLDFIPEDTMVFKKAARKAGLKTGAKKTGFLVQGDDHVGAVADIVTRLAEANINITAIDALCAGERRFGAILWVKPPDVSKASRVLGAA